VICARKKIAFIVKEVVHPSTRIRKCRSEFDCTANLCEENPMIASVEARPERTHGESHNEPGELSQLQDE
jgi:hypothetical protein